MSNFSRAPAMPARNTILYFYLKNHNKWIPLNKVENHNYFERGTFYANLETNFTNFENIIRDNLFTPIMNLTKNQKLSQSNTNFIINYIAAVIAINPNNINLLRKRADLMRLEVIAEEGSAHQDIDNEPIYTIIHAINKILLLSEYIFNLKVFNNKQLLACPNNTIICAKRCNKKLGYLIMPISYNKVIIGSLPSDNIHLDELTIDIINNLSYQSDCDKLCADSQVNLNIGNPKILRQYTINKLII